MKKTLTILFLQIIFVSGLLFYFSTYNSKEKIPDSITTGLNKLKESDPKAAVNYWIKNLSPERLNSTVDIFENIENNFGDYQNFELYKSYEISSRVTIYLIVLHYETREIYSIFKTYRKQKNDPSVIHYSVNTDFEKMWPEEVIYK